MQSGISASTQLQDAFNNFTYDSSLFALPVTIAGEALTPLPPIKFTSADFFASLSSLTEHLQPKTPIYLLLRRSPDTSHDLIAVTYVPSVAPVRSKMLFASTRATLVRDLGLEKFGDSVFATDAEEVLERAQWEQRAKTSAAAKDGANTDILSTEERELQGVKRAEEEERHGTSGRDLMGEGGSGGSLKMKVNEDVKNALEQLNQPSNLVQLGIQLSSESLELLESKSSLGPASLKDVIPADRPTYTFYHHPDSSSVIFIYTCPGTSKVKERMMYASSLNGVLEMAKAQGIQIAKRLELGGPEEITDDRMSEELGLKSESQSGAGPRQAFARPKRPGKR